MIKIDMKKTIGIDGSMYSSIKNYQIITNYFDNEKIYGKYISLLKRVYKFLKKNDYNITEFKIFKQKLFDRFSFQIEKFCITNLNLIDISIFYDVFNHIIYDIFIRLKLIKLNSNDNR